MYVRGAITEDQAHKAQIETDNQLILMKKKLRMFFPDEE